MKTRKEEWRNIDVWNLCYTLRVRLIWLYFHSQLSVSMHLYKLLSMYIHGQLINISYSDNISYLESTMVAELVDP